MLCCKVHSTPLPPRLTKSSGDDLFYVSFCIGVSIRIGREIRCLPYAGFFLKFLFGELKEEHHRLEVRRQTDTYIYIEKKISYLSNYNILNI
mgnify:CR=1 FL=1